MRRLQGQSCLSESRASICDFSLKMGFLILVYQQERNSKPKLDGEKWFSLYIYMFRVVRFRSLKKCNPIYPVSSWGSLTLNFLPRLVHLSPKAQKGHVSLSRCAGWYSFAPARAVLAPCRPPCALSSPWVFAFLMKDRNMWDGLWEPNGRTREYRVMGFSISSISANFPWIKWVLAVVKFTTSWWSSWVEAFCPQDG